MNIIEEKDFSGSYGKAKETLSLPQNKFYLDLLKECTTNSDFLAFVKYANNLLEVPPVKSFLLLFEEQIKNETKGEITDPNLKQALGAWFGYLFQKKYGMKKDEFLAAFGGLEMVKYDSKMRKAIEILKLEK